MDVKVTFEPDQNAEKYFSSIQVCFFSSRSPPFYVVKQVLGFVEELVEFKRRDDDILDQGMLQDSVMKLRKKIGRIVLKRGGNAVITYR